MTDSAAYRHTAMGLALIALVFLLYGLFLVRKQDITMADIGRHLRSGERLLQDGQLVRTNLYSYTAPDEPAVNHHWGAGALFYAVWKWTGFTGLHVFFAAVALLAFGIFYSLAIDHAGLGAASMAAAVIVPTLALRVEIRPEVFTSLFAGVFLWLLLKYRERKAPFLWLAIALPVLEIFWVNLQIFFPLGEEVVLSATAQAIANSFAAVKGCRSMEGWGYRFLASDHHLPDLPARETVGRMPDAARKDLLEWYARNDLLNIVSDVLLRDVTL